MMMLGADMTKLNDIFTIESAARDHLIQPWDEIGKLGKEIRPLITSAENMTSDWLTFTSQRLNLFLRTREKFTKLHGEETFQDKKHFYSKMVEFFSDSSISGIRIVAKKLN